MRIATWNINGIRARYDFMADWLRQRRPDIVGLQELKSEDDEFPFDDVARLGYHAVTHGQRAWNGVAVLSRDPVEVVQVGLPGHEEDGARLLAVRASDLNYVTVYCPNGKSVDHPDFARKLSWFDGLHDFIETNYTPDDALIVAGDFNVVPTAADSWSEDLLEGSIFHTVAERERIARFAEWGLFDVWRTRNPDKVAFTWWDYRSNAFKRKRGLRIDFLLATNPVLQRVTAVAPDEAWRAYRGEQIASDHAPLYMDLANADEIYPHAG